MKELEREAGQEVSVQEQAEVLVYIGDMAASLAQMAQKVGHQGLSEHLYHAAQKARGPMA
ncbi:MULTISPECIES: hypothetical protein [Asticcacaulis]|jgi:hypothetical protein|uniref:Uncharacterized protein n=1 Tax=Asticcacaulis endophyticus TaxID=1395890 RepID=A0A918UUK2_9CAUL|nr:MULTISPECIES: hypothetical protein [Asticcacaulis]WKL57292.1 hypothetical protein Q1W73_16755 [Asticcacaulis sp. ZE23SCel15]GGZ35193.1 hypothetical protein GCM10011273_22130 [Asticcacaulis endophyticus]